MISVAPAVPPSPHLIRADVFTGTIHLPVPSQRPQVPVFGLKEEDFFKKPPQVVPARPIQLDHDQKVVDARTFDGPQFINWLLEFTNTMHRGVFREWNIRDKATVPRKYPPDYVAKLVDAGFSPEEAEQFWYVGSSHYVYVDKTGTSYQIIPQLDLETMATASLYVVQGGMGVKLALTEGRVVQESLNLVLLQESFLNFCGLKPQVRPHIQLKRAALWVYEDQFADLSWLVSDPKTEVVIGDESEMRRALGEDYFDRLVGQARVTASVNGQKQVLVKVNVIFAGENGILLEVIVNRPHIPGLLSRPDEPLENRSQPLGGRLGENLQRHLGRLEHNRLTSADTDDPNRAIDG